MPTAPGRSPYSHRLPMISNGVSPRHRGNNLILKSDGGVTQRYLTPGFHSSVGRYLISVSQ